MKFLLAAVNAKYIHSNPAVYSLRACAGDELRPCIDLAEYTINQRMQDILADIYGRKPDAIGFSCYIWNWDMVRRLIPEISKLLPGTDIWLGGPEVTCDAPQILLQYPQLTGVMAGEGELTFRDLMRYYVGGGELKNIAGLYYLQKDGEEKIPFYTGGREMADFTALPFPYEDLTCFDNRIIYYETSRGCPFQCSYCLSSLDKKVRFRDIGVVKKELQFFLDRNVRQIKFVDRTFNCNHEHAAAIWRYIKEHDNGVTNFHFEISADLLQKEEIALLHTFRPGLAQLEIGVQSTNPDTIEAVHRVMDVEKLEQAVAAVREGENIHLHLDLIAGLPYEDYESFARSFNRVYAMRPQQLQLGFLKVLKGSLMQEKAEEYGIGYLTEPPYEVLYTKWLSYEDVLRLKRIEEMVETYYNSGQFVHTIRFLEGAFDSPFAMFEKLAEFYRQGGYFAHSPARSERYKVLFCFAQIFDEKYTALCRELLTFDLYLRENAKNHRRMTHQEPFCYPVWDEDLMNGYRTRGQTAEQPVQYVLFDYNAARDPLTNDAVFRVVRSES